MANFRTNIQPRIALSLATVVLLSGLAVWASYSAYRQVEEITRERKHSYQVIDYAEDLLSALQDAETGQRGYLLTGNETFLEPYKAVFGHVNSHVDKLRGAGTSGAARVHLDALIPLVVSKVAEMEQAVALNRRREVNAAITLVASGRGKLLMDSIRSETASFLQIEHSSLAQHETQAQVTTRYLYFLIVGSILASTAFGLLTIYFSHLEAKHRFKDQVLLKTEYLLQLQEQTSQQLMQVNVDLQISEEELRLFADNVPVMTAAFDGNLYCSFSNRHYAEYFGFSASDIIGRHLSGIIGKAVYTEFEGHFAKVIQGHPVTYQRKHTLPNGQLCDLEVKLVPKLIADGQVTGCFVVTTDITEHKLVAERIQSIAHHDSLTGLPNRLLFSDRLNHAMSLAKRDTCQFALLFLDLDKFKPVNDTFGHAIGDELLKGVAGRIRSEVRESDTVARVGGDEFVVILPDISTREMAEAVARKIIVALAMPFQLGAQKQIVEVGASIGIAIYPADASDADGLIKAADAAMYSAKQVGGSYRSCDPSQSPEAQAST
jgi:diguanylate cyclase (GGDEF)-like protein/PAS domain S-box-containing protein